MNKRIADSYLRRTLGLSRVEWEETRRTATRLRVDPRSVIAAALLARLDRDRKRGLLPER